MRKKQEVGEEPPKPVIFIWVGEDENFLGFQSSLKKGIK